MKIRFRNLVLFTLLTAACSAALIPYAQAQADDSEPPLTSNELQLIQDNCVALKHTLQQLNYSDTALRVNQGQYYEEISTKLMAPMNSRIALNQYDGGTLVSIAADYTSTINTFRSRYTTYANALNTARRDDCSNQPQQFYDDIVTARKARLSLHDTVVELNGKIAKYAKQFASFTHTLPENGDTAQ